MLFLDPPIRAGHLFQDLAKKSSKKLDPAKDQNLFRISMKNQGDLLMLLGNLGLVLLLMCRRGFCPYF